MTMKLMIKIINCMYLRMLLGELFIAVNMHEMWLNIFYVYQKFTTAPSYALYEYPCFLNSGPIAYHVY